MAPISLVSNPNISVQLQESAGNASLVITPSLSVGGGDVAGFLGFSGSLTLALKGQVLESAMFQYLEAKYPAAAAEIAAIKVVVDAALAGV
jgi:hypothetical protein